MHMRMPKLVQNTCTPHAPVPADAVVITSSQRPTVDAASLPRIMRGSGQSPWRDGTASNQTVHARTSSPDWPPSQKPATCFPCVLRTYCPLLPSSGSVPLRRFVARLDSSGDDAVAFCELHGAGAISPAADTRGPDIVELPPAAREGDIAASRPATSQHRMACSCLCSYIAGAQALRNSRQEKHARTQMEKKTRAKTGVGPVCPLRCNPPSKIWQFANSLCCPYRSAHAPPFSSLHTTTTTTTTTTHSPPSHLSERTEHGVTSRGIEAVDCG